jgi:feruloyl esterase
LGHLAPTWDGLWAAYDPQKRIDFGYRGVHVATLAAKAITAAFYGQPPRHAYFSGCSGGGREGLSAAQRFPDDFDGVLAGAPVVAVIANNTFFYGWNIRANFGADGRPILTVDKLPLLHEAALRACDSRDGLEDRQIDDPRACGFDPAAITCAPGQEPSTCLSAQQAEVVRKVLQGPRDDHGHRLYVSGSPIGSEPSWTNLMVPARPGEPAAAAASAMSFLKYMATWRSPPADLTLRDLRFDEAMFRDLHQIHGIYDAMNPDLRPFATGGGKLILWHGWADSRVPPASTLAYHAALRKTMGDAAVDGFARLYMLPGMFHCIGGEGPHAFDLLTPLMDWVESGIAPSRIVASKLVEGKATRTRPVFPYPTVARYTGSGSIDDAANFTPQEPPQHYDDGVDWLGADLFRGGLEQWCGWDGMRFWCSATRDQPR